MYGKVACVYKNKSVINIKTVLLTLCYVTAMDKVGETFCQSLVHACFAKHCKIYIILYILYTCLLQN